LGVFGRPPPARPRHGRSISHPHQFVGQPGCGAGVELDGVADEVSARDPDEQAATIAVGDGAPRRGGEFRLWDWSGCGVNNRHEIGGSVIAYGYDGIQSQPDYLEDAANKLDGLAGKVAAAKGNSRATVTCRRSTCCPGRWPWLGR
jgi:hypothetical protein